MNCIQSLKLVFLVLVPLYLSGCASTQEGTPVVTKHAKKGYNKPYQINGRWHHPQCHYEYSEVGTASFYGGGDVFHGRPTSTGEKFDMHAISAAHKTLPLPCVVRVTNVSNGRSIKLKVNDRGPFVGDRIIDLSRKSARLLGFENKGVQKVRVECLVNESIQLAHHYHPHKNPNGKMGKHPVVQVTQHKKEAPAPKKRQEQPPIMVATKQPPKRPEPKIKEEDNTPLGLDMAPTPPAKIQKASFDVPPKKSTNQKPLQAMHRGVPPKPKMAGGHGNLYLNVGQYKTPQMAAQAAQKIQNSLPVPLETRKVIKGSKTEYRLVAGPISSSQQAKNLLNKVRMRGAREAYVVAR